MYIRWDFANMSDSELMYWRHFAQEYRDRRYLELINQEIQRRWFYE